MPKEGVNSQFSALGALGFSHDEITLILKGSVDNDHERIQKSRLMAEVEVRKQIYKMAKEGSPHAVKEYLGFVRNRQNMMRAVDLPLDHHDFTQKQLYLLDGLLRFRGNISKACKFSGVAVPTYYYWMNSTMEKHQKFQEAVKIARNVIKDAVEEVIMDKVLDERNDTMIQFYARTQMRDRGYNERYPSNGDGDEFATLPDGTISIEAQRFVEAVDTGKRVHKVVSGALEILNRIDQNGEKHGAEDSAIEAEFTESKSE